MFGDGHIYLKFYFIILLGDNFSVTIYWKVFHYIRTKVNIHMKYSAPSKHEFSLDNNGQVVMTVGYHTEFCVSI